MLARLKSWTGAAFLRVLGWRLIPMPERPQKFVLLCVPHTSNWDTVFMIAMAWEYRMPINFLVKKEMIDSPLGPLLRALGGVPIDRSQRHNIVEQVSQSFAERSSLVLCIAPEGTRGYTDHWKSGFYHIALAADVPIGLGLLDFGKKLGGVGPIYKLTGDVAADMGRIREFYRGAKGLHPEWSGEIVLQAELAEQKAR